MPDRLAALLASPTLNGIDFVEVASDDQTTLVVHFHTVVTVAGTLAGAQPVTITGGEAVPEVPVEPVTAGDWSTDDEGRPLLHLTTAYAGDFSWYDLTIVSPVLDPYYAAAQFTFKARCPTDLDCAPPPVECPPEDRPVPAIDYLAKDFASFTRALSDYSAVAYPDYVERSEADLGTVLKELIAAVGDDLSYLQDRVAAEATLQTATQRQSVIQHARLVDYEPRPATSSRVTLQVDVAATTLPAGAQFAAATPTGLAVTFEVGEGLADPGTGQVATTPVAVDPRWNAWDPAAAQWRIVPHLWDDTQGCLRVGATSMWVVGTGYGFQAGDPHQGTVGAALLLDTPAAAPLDPPVREIVHLTGVAEEFDPLLGVPLTRLSWSAADALRYDHDLTRTHCAGNLLTATEGQRHTDRFVIDPPPGPLGAASPAVARCGPRTRCADPAPVYRHTLQRGRLAWLAPAPDPESGAGAEPPRPRPEVVLTEAPTAPGDPPRTWQWRRRLLDAAPFEPAFTLEAARYTDLRNAVERLSGQPRFEYDGDDADTLLFSAGELAQRPAPRAAFDVTYRVSSGALGNVAADTVTGVPSALQGLVSSVTNPFAATGGADAEPLDEVRRAAPQAFRARQLRAVRAADYEAAAEELAWVLDAGTVFRWSGSWLTVFTTAQPRGGGSVPVADRVGLARLLDRRRLAGYEGYPPVPRYVGIDLVVEVCARAWALRGEVEAAVLRELGTGVRADGEPAFFAPDRFRFGTPLERSEIEIAVQRVFGVDGVVAVRYRRRGLVPTLVSMDDTVAVGRDEIVRVDNDPSRPERGSLRVVVRGGK